MNLQTVSSGSQSLSNAALQSQVITFLRFPLIVGVVMIHTLPHQVTIGGIEFVDISKFRLYDYTFYLISEVLARIAVPLFFFISGFLFFKGDFTIDSYFLKLKRRARTILLPYIIWNLLVTAMFLFLQTFMSGLTSGKNLLIAEMPVKLWLSLFWDYHDGMPICYQMWFLRDLMVVMVLSPVLYWCINRFRQYFIIFLGFLWLINFWVSIPGMSISAFFFFTAGAWFRINKINFVDTMTPFMKSATAVYILLCAANLCLRQYEWVCYIHRFGILAGIVVAVTVSAYCITARRYKPNEFLSESSFFIYAYHATVLGLLSKLVVKTVVPASDMEMLAIYFISPAVTILIGLGIYSCLKRFFPKFTSLITGGR